MDEWVLALWHDEFNAACFDGVLPTCTFVFGESKTVRSFVAMAEYIADGHGKGTILLDPRHCVDIPTARACLAHEMIHQWQDLCGLRLDHRAVFNAWCEHVTNITGVVP